MKFAYEYLRPAWGPRARAVPGGGDGNREGSPPVDPSWYPRPQPGRDVGPGVLPGSFPRAESRSATLAAVTTFAEIARFSGRPDRIDLHSSAAGVEFRFRNRGQDATTGLVVRAAGSYETDASFDLVEARDPAGAGGQLVTAVGFWSAESTAD